MNELLVVTPNGYKTSKLYSVVPANGTGDLTWVRNTTATRVNSSGLIESVGANVPRLDYSGGVTCPCILVEPQRTNYIFRSQEFDNASWNVKFNLNTTGVPAWINQAVAPDGTTTAEKIIPNTTNINHYISQTRTTVANKYLTLYAKADGYSWIYLGGLGRTPTDGLSEGYAFFNVSTGAVGQTSENTVGNIIAKSIESVGNGWFRIKVRVVSSASANFEFRIGISNADGIQSFPGDGTSGVYVWGAQMESGTTVTSYIPTTTAAVTRNADVATVTTPVGITSLIETYEDNTTNVVNPIPVTYQMSEGRIAKVVGL